MAGSDVLRQLAALNSAIAAVEVGPGNSEASVQELEEVKRGLDDARLGLWARLQGVHALDARSFVEQFRIRRSIEIATRLTTDLRLGLLDPGHAEFEELLGTTLDLAAAIHAGRRRPGTL